MAGTNSISISSILEKMKNVDHDFRFMAVRDLMRDLDSGTTKFDDDSERKIVKGVLELLKDPNTEVKNIAIKCIPSLVGNCKPEQAALIIKNLCDNVENKDSSNLQHRDVSCIAMKRVIEALKVKYGKSDSVITNLIQTIALKCSDILLKDKEADGGVVLELLSIIGELLSLFPNQLLKLHEPLFAALQSNLTQSGTIQKRAIHCLSIIAKDASDEFFTNLLDYIQTVGKEDIRIETLKGIAKTGNKRLIPYIEQSIEFSCTALNSEHSDDTLKENCLLLNEIILRRYSSVCLQFMDVLKKCAVQYMSYDPNYNYDVADMEEDDDYYGDDSEDGFSDDEDISWKIRRAAVKQLEAIIKTQSLRHLEELYICIGAPLIERFKEREENVLIEILTAYSMLLSSTKVISRGMDIDGWRPLLILKQQLPLLLEGVTQVLKSKSARNRLEAVKVLAVLSTVCPGILNGFIQPILEKIKAIEVKNQQDLKLEIINFLAALVRHHDIPELLAVLSEYLIPFALVFNEDAHYKIRAEALEYTNEILQKFSSQTDLISNAQLYKLYDSIVNHMNRDVDLDGKEKCMMTLGELLSSFGGKISDKVQNIMLIFESKLDNEPMRVIVLKALNMVVRSSEKFDLSPYLQNLVKISASYLKKLSRSVRLSALCLLDGIMDRHAQVIPESTADCVFVNLHEMIDDRDIQITSYALSIIEKTQKVHQNSIRKVALQIAGPTIKMAHSEVIYGACLDSLVNVLCGLSHLGIKNLHNDKIIEIISNNIMELAEQCPKTQKIMLTSSIKSSFLSASKCVAALVRLDSETLGIKCINWLATIKNSNNSLRSEDRVFAFLLLGEVGQHTDLSELPDLKKTYIETLRSDNDDLKIAAATGFGKLCLGNIDVFLPDLLAMIENDIELQFLLLQSLKEVIIQLVRHGDEVTIIVNRISPKLLEVFTQISENNEGVRNTVAECWGKLCTVNPEVMLTPVIKLSKSSHNRARSTAIATFKCALMNKNKVLSTYLYSMAPEMFKLIGDELVDVRLVALLAFNTAIKHQEHMVRSCLESCLPLLYKETQVRKELVREVQMGPFKHTVDNGLDCRKAAFECLYSLLETCIDQIEIYSFFDHVQKALEDHNDVKTLGFMFIEKLVKTHPQLLAEKIQTLTQSLLLTLHLKVKSQAVKQEAEKTDDLKKEALKVFRRLLQIPDIEKSVAASEFLNTIKQSNDLKKIYDQVLCEEKRSRFENGSGDTQMIEV